MYTSIMYKRNKLLRNWYFPRQSLDKKIRESRCPQAAFSFSRTRVKRKNRSGKRTAWVTQTCQSIGNNSVPERFVSVAGTSVDAEKLHNNGSNGLKDLQQPYAKSYDRQEQTNETPDISESDTQTKVPILSSTSTKGHYDDQHQSTFHSNDSLSQYQGQDKEIFTYGDHNSIENHSAQVEHDGELELHHSSKNDVNKEKNPVTVSESDSDDDTTDGCPNPLPTTNNTDNCAKMLMVNRFTTAVHVEYRQFSKLATVIYSDPELRCFNTNDRVSLSEVLQLFDKPKKGGNGEMYRCTLQDCKSSKQLACKREHRDFDKLCQLKGNQFFLPILAYLLEYCECGEKHCSGYVGYLIMEYLPIGNICNIVCHLKSHLFKTIERLKKRESTMTGANHIEWRKCQQPWQKEQSLKLKYLSAIMRLIGGALYSMNQFHELGLLHLDIKEGNFLVRKRCHHTNTLDCDCDHLDFDVLLMDYDYVHTERTEIQDPTHTGTYHYRALPLLFPHDYNMMVKAERLFDYYSLCVMIISIICGEKWCTKIMEEWKRYIIRAARMKDVEAAEMMKELATSRLIANVKCIWSEYSTYDQTIDCYVKYMETKLKECVKHFCAGQK